MGIQISKTTEIKSDGIDGYKTTTADWQPKPRVCFDVKIK